LTQLLASSEALKKGRERLEEQAELEAEKLAASEAKAAAASKATK
jgi:hypothetical protein